MGPDVENERTTKPERAASALDDGFDHTGGSMTLDEAIAHAGEKAGDETECRREHKQLAGWLRDLKECRATLAELVALKAMKDELSHMLLREEGGMGLDYDRRKPLAWQRARELVGSNVELRGGPAVSSPERPA